jgi:cyclic beta-1,2-glucan synthetase
MYRAGLESILGLRRRGRTFELDPCIPSSWPEYGITWRLGRTRYEITVTNPRRRCRGVEAARLDGVEVDPRAIPLSDDGKDHRVQVVLGDPRPLAADPHRAPPADAPSPERARPA